jgi:fibronectin type 3 domain-containing protein
MRNFKLTISLSLFAASFLFSVVSAQTANRVFVTSTQYNAELGQLTGSDAKCQERANAAGLGGVWRSWISFNDSTAPATRFPRSTNPYIRLDGVTIANNWIDLTDGSLSAPINVTELGTIKSSNVWTNVTLSGGNAGTSHTGSNCYEWGYAGGWGPFYWIYGNIGNSSQNNNSWTSAGGQRCWENAALYCFEMAGVTPPSAPRNLSLGIDSVSGKYLLNWSAPSTDGGSPILNYSLYRGTSSSNKTLIANLDKSVLSYTDATAVDGAAYYYHVIAVNIGGNGAASNEVNTLSLPPAPPRNLKAVGAEGRVSLSWQVPTLTGGSPITNYKIYRGTSSGGETLLTTIGNILSYSDMSVTNGVTYYYKVKAVNAGGESDFSSEANGVSSLGRLVFVTSSAYNGVLGGLKGADVKCQAAADSAGLGGVWRAWLSGGGISASSRLAPSNTPYRLVNGTFVANNWTDLTDGSLLAPINISEKGTTVNNYVWTHTLANGTAGGRGGDCGSWNDYYGGYGSVGHSSYKDQNWTYYWSNWYCSSWSGGANLYCIEQVPSPPTAPKNLAASFGDKKITLNWKTPDFSGIPNVSSYKIYRGTTSGGEAFIGSVSGDTLTYTDTGLTNGTKYYYKVSAANTVGESSMSNEVSIEPTKALKVFVTSANYSGGNLGGIAGADAKCQAAATSLGGTWRALISDSGNTAKSRISSTTISYKLLDGITIAHNTNDLFDGSLLAPINKNEFGQVESATGQYGFQTRVFTGTTPSGSPSPSNCSNWTSTSIWSYGSYGDIGSSDGSWTAWAGGTGATWHCGTGSAQKLYCAELDPLEAPKDLTLSIVSGKVTLNWKAPVIGGSQGYKVYRSTTSKGQADPPIATVSGTTLTFTDNSITNRDTKYFYKVKSIRPEGDSDFSNEVALPAVPSAPTSLQATSGAGKITLNWTLVNDGGSPVTSYKIYKSDVSGGEVFVGEIPATSMVCCDSNYNLYEVKVPPYTDSMGTSYSNRKNFYYKISAVNVAGESRLSAEVSAMPMTVPAIKNVIATPGEGKVSLTWQVDDGGSPLTTRQSTAGPFVYGIDRSPGGGLLAMSSTNSAVVEFPSSQLNPPQNQYFGVYTQNTVGQSEYGVVYATPKHISGTWVTASGSGAASETCDAWLLRTGQKGKRSRAKNLDVSGYGSDSNCAFFAPAPICYPSPRCPAYYTYIPERNSCLSIPDLTYCVPSSTDGWGVVGGANRTGNVNYFGYYPNNMGVAIKSFYGMYDFYPTKGYRGSEVVTQTLQGDGPSLTVTKGGTGTGTVTGTGIDCGTTCSTNYVKDDSYSFTATPDEDSVFSGWAGDCSDAGTNSTCTITMDSDKTITANFDLKPRYDLTVVKDGAGSGNVSGPGISCGSDCTEDYVIGTSVTLTASPASGSIFSGWSGPCSGTGDCTITMNDVKMVTATFNPPTFQLQVTKTGDGSGTVTSSPAGINCGGDCTEEYSTGSIVMITATPDSGSEFVEWTGSCIGTDPTCALNMDSPKTATASFSKSSFQATTTPGGIREVRP